MISHKSKPKENQISHRKNLLILVGIAILTEIIVFFVTPTIFKTFIDTWDYQVYYNTLVVPFITRGEIPYINYDWEYPPIMLIPVILSAIPSIILSNNTAFFVTFPILMTICSLITLVCVYYTTIKIYNNTKKAFIAAFLFATAFSTAYFVLTKYDAWPTCLLMIGITCTLYGGTLRKYGYITTVIGFFAKIYPVIILPFILIFNAKTTTIKGEIVDLLKIIIPLFVVLFIPMVLINPQSIGTYLIQTASGKGAFSMSLVYTIYSWINGILGIAIQTSTISLMMSLTMVVFLFTIVYLAYIDKGKSPVLLLEMILCALVIVVTFSQYHSPQYMMWFIPVLSILVAGDIFKMVIFYVFQAIEFIKFPLMFGTFYTNQAYTNVPRSPNGTLTLVFFTIEYIVLFYLVWTSIKNLKALSREKYESYK
jgi:hypothetical protein